MAGDAVAIVAGERPVRTWRVLEQVVARRGAAPRESLVVLPGERMMLVAPHRPGYPEIVFSAVAASGCHVDAELGAPRLDAIACHTRPRACRGVGESPRTAAGTVLRAELRALRRVKEEHAAR